MSQSSSVVAFLLVAFVLFVAAKGKLANYTAVLWGNTKAATPKSGSGGGGGGLAGDIKTAVGVGKTVAGAASILGL